MYQKGMVKISEEDEWGNWPYVEPGNVYLPHSCDEWEIGSEAEIEALIEDLQAVLAKMRSPDYVKPVKPEPEPQEYKEPVPLTEEELARIAALTEKNGGGRMGTILAYMQFSAEKGMQDFYSQPSPFLSSFMNSKKEGK